MKKLMVFFFILNVCFAQQNKIALYSIEDIDSADWTIVIPNRENKFDYYKERKPFKPSKQELDKAITFLFNYSIDKNYTHYQIKSHKEFIRLMNNDSKKETKNLIDIQDYKIQLLPIIDEKGNKTIEVNAFCKENINRSSNDMEQWRYRFISAKDGGKCYWGGTINLNKKEFEIYFNPEH